MAVTVEDILKVRVGKPAEFECVDPLSAKSGQSLVSYVKKFRANDMPKNVADYKTSIVGNVLKIEAVEVESES